MDVSQKVVLAGLRQLSQKYKGKGVEAVTVQKVNGNIVYLMRGPTKAPPPGLPGRITLPDVRGKQVIIPILWAPTPTGVGADWMYSPDGPVKPAQKPDEEDVDISMWRGFTPIDRRDVATQYFPGPVEKEVTAGPIPETQTQELRISVDTTGEWGWWTKPFDTQACLCCTLYSLPTLIFTYVVPQDYCLFIDAWAFTVDSGLPVGETFNVRFVRDGETLLEYNEVIVDPLNPDPSKRCLFSGSSEQVQHSYLRIDRNQTLNIIITPLGLAPFLKGPNDTYCATICILLHGHLEALLDNRDGAPRPKDVGRLRDDLWGDGALMQVTTEDVAQLLAWLDSSTANTADSKDAAILAASQAATEAANAAVAAAMAEAKAKEAAKLSAADKAKIGGTLAAAAAAALLLNGEGSSVSPSPLS